MSIAKRTKGIRRNLARAGAAAGMRSGWRIGRRTARSAARSRARSLRTGARAALLGAKLGARAGALTPAMRARLTELQRGARDAGSLASAPSTAGFCSGVAAMYFLDPVSGRRRRHVARERAMKLMRRGARTAAKRARYGEGVAEGKLHAMRSEDAQQSAELPDDVTLTRMVESAIARQPGTPSGAVNVNAENGVVYLRGEVDGLERAELLVSAARSVHGVLGVKNLLHLPGQTAPTMEDARSR